MCLICKILLFIAKAQELDFSFFCIIVIPKVLTYTFFYQNRRMNNAEQSSAVDMLEMHISVVVNSHNETIVHFMIKA